VKEKRRVKRRHLIYYLRVFEKNADQPIGHMVDISAEGMMLISEDPIKTGSVFELKMVLPVEIDGSREIIFSAESKWCREDENPDFYNTGFQLINFSAEHIKITEHLIHKFCFKEPLDRL
jgi:PilZ domain-containing protein